MASEYTTRSGDTWDAVSFRAYGSEFYTDVLIDANPAHNYVARFDAGVVLEVPDLPTPTPVTNLPPWRLP